MRLKAILLGVVAGVAVIGTVGGIMLGRMDFDTYYRGAILKKVAQTTGRTLVIGGELKLGFLPAPALTVKDVSLSNPDRAATAHMVEIGELSAQIALLPLLFTGKLHFDRLVLKDVDLKLATDANGRGNWLFGAPEQSPHPDDGGLDVPSFDQITLRNIGVTYDDGQTHKKTAISIGEFLLSGSPTGPMKVSAAALYQDQPVTVKGTVGELSSLMNPGRPYRIDAVVTAAGATVKVVGGMAEPLAGRGLDLTVSAEGKDISAIGKLFAVQLPKSPYQFSTIVGGDAGGTMTLKTVRVAIGATTLSGEARLTVNGPRPKLGATVDAAQIDLTELLGPNEKTPRHPGADDRVFDKEPLPLAALRLADADITLHAALVKGAAITPRNLAAHLTLDDGTLRIKPFAFDLDGGHVGGNLELSSRQTPALLALDFDAKHLELGRLLFLLSGDDILEGRGDLAVTAHGGGASVRAIMATLGGTSSLVMGHGIIKNRYADLVGADVFREAFAWTQGKQDTKLICMVSRFDIRNGLATSRDLLIDTEDVTIVGEGTVNFASERLDLELTPRPKEISLLNLAMPLDIGGTFRRPSFQPNRLAMAKDVAKGVATWINPLFALVPMVLASADDKTPCIAAIEMRGNRGGRSDAAEGGIGGAVKGLGRSIENIFK